MAPFRTDNVGSGTAQRSVADLIYAALNVHPGNLIARAASSSAVANRKHEWVEQALQPDTVTYDTTDGNIDGSASNARFDSGGDYGTLKVGDFLKNITQNIPELMQVTVITDESNITVTRGYGATDGSTSHADGDVFAIIPAELEASAIGDDQTLARSVKYNYTQIMSKAIKISRSEIMTAMHGISDEFQNSLMHRTLELKNRLNYAFINQTGSAAPTGSVYGAMHGIIPMILTGGDITASSFTAAAAGTVIDPTATLDYEAISDLMGVVAYGNGNRDGDFVIAADMTEYQKIAQFADGQIRRAYSEQGQTYGGVVDKLISMQGIMADVILEPDMPKGHLAVLDMNRLSLRPLVGSELLLYVDDIGDQGNDYKQARLVLEWTLEMHNADTAHGLMNAITA